MVATGLFNERDAVCERAMYRRIASSRFDAEEYPPMLFLILSIVFMSGLAISLGVGGQRGLNAIGLNAIFRTTGGILGILGFLLWGDRANLPEIWSRVGALAFTAGCFYWLAGIAAIQAVRLGHLGVTWTVTRCAVVLPTLASMIFWRELPLWPVTPLLLARLAGLVLTLVVAFLIGMDRRRPHPGDCAHPVSATWIVWLATAFLAQGAWEITLRASGAFQDETARGVFIATVFVTAMIFALGAWMLRRPCVGRGELCYGVLAGVCAVLGSGLRPWVLRDLPGIVVFPVTAVSVMLLVQLAARVLLRHRLSGWGRAALAVAVVAIIFLTIRV